MGALAVVSVRLPFFFAAGSMLLAGIALAAAGPLRQLGVTKPDLDHTPVGGLQGQTLATERPRNASF
jgi:hypothetical protein